MVVGRGDVKRQSQVRLDEFPEEIRYEADDTMDPPDIRRGTEHASTDQCNKDEVPKNLSGQQRLQGEIPLKRSPRQREQKVTEQHAAPPLPERHGRTRPCRAIVLQRAQS